MESNLDWMGIAGITFVVAMTLIIAWIGRAVILKGMDMTLAREQAKADLKHQGELRRIAQEATQAQQTISEQLKRLEGIEERLGSVERMLREVDEPSLTASR
ncbi:MAG: hypothetical protein O2798_08710 [Chloroflexi bacterium]|nr:hypothetical protein [Chloroflexota bacterium]MDA1240905.1 hypothetical protein [Chloroflexota bacterium]MQC25512.1 hypothetical protein [Chloroflexota bacterium]